MTQEAYYSPLAIFPLFFLKKALAEGRE